MSNRHFFGKEEKRNDGNNGDCPAGCFCMCIIDY